MKTFLCFLTIAWQNLIVYEDLYAWFPLSFNFIVLAQYQLYLTLWPCASFTYFNFTTNTYLRLCNIPVLNSFLFRAQLCKKILLTLLLATIVFASLKLFLYPLLSLLLGPLLLPLKLPWLTVTLAAYIALHDTSLLIPGLIFIGSFLPHSLSHEGFSLDLTLVKSWLRQIKGNIGIYRQINSSKLEQITNTKNTMGNVKSYIFL